MRTFRFILYNLKGDLAYETKAKDIEEVFLRARNLVKEFKLMGDKDTRLIEVKEIFA